MKKEKKQETRRRGRGNINVEIYPFMSRYLDILMKLCVNIQAFFIFYFIFSI